MIRERGVKEAVSVQLRNRLQFVLALTLAAAACAPAAAAQEGAHGSAGVVQLLAYEAGLPPDFKVVGTKSDGGVTVDDVTFRAAAGDNPGRAYLVRPTEGRGPFAGILFVHWFAPGRPTSNRTQFLDEARSLARGGAVSLLVSAFWSDANRYKSRRWQDDFRNTVEQARELRRALDVLLAQPGVDPRRVGFVGHDYGAMFGALVAAVDARPKTYVLVAGASRFPDWYLYGSASGVPAGAELERFREQFVALDPVSVIGGAKASFLLQYGEEDRFTPREDFVALYLAAPAPKRLVTYASGHAMDSESILRDRAAWLALNLGLGN